MTTTAFLTDARALALELGLLAAERLRQAAAQTLQIEEKAQGDWCSALDREIEAMLRERIAQRYPQHRFWGEESHSGTPSVEQFQEQLVWVVDPIDGSMNFLRGYPQYAVSIALLVGGQPVVACIVDPVREEAYTAARGLGATCNGRPLAAAPTAQLSQAVAATVFPKPRAPFMDDYLRELSVVMKNVSGVRRAGSAALDLSDVARGRFDGFWELFLNPWDLAGGVLLVREAGGRVTDLEGRDARLTSGAIVASNGILHDWFLGMLNEGESITTVSAPDPA
jgi:myo-inositol-1(or 4)-monophosphatase